MITLAKDDFMTAWDIFEIGVNLFESLLFLFFIKNRLHIVRRNLAADLICISAYTAFLSLYTFFPISIPDSVGAIILFVYALYISNEKWYTCALWVVVNEIVVVVIISLTTQGYGFLFSQPYDALLVPGVQRVCYVLISNLALTIVLFSISRIKKRNTSLNWSALFIFLCINLLILFVAALLFPIQVHNLFKYNLLFATLYIILAIISVLSMALLYIMTTMSEKRHQYELAFNQAKISRANQQTLKDMYAGLVAKQHDFKHQLQTLELLIMSGNVEDAKKYFNDYKLKVVNTGITFVTGNLAIDALMTAKALTCEKKQIAFEYTSYPLNDLPIPEVDFCAIVGNLLDNAIEGAERIVNANESRWVHLTFSRIWDMFYIICENSMQPETIRRFGGKFISSKKENESGHGYGIQNIIEIVDDSQGIYSFDTKENVFTATITLPYLPNRRGDNVDS